MKVFKISYQGRDYTIAISRYSNIMPNQQEAYSLDLAQKIRGQ